MSVSFLLGIPGKVKKVATDVGTLLSRLTATRAAKLDNIAITPKCTNIKINYQAPSDGPHTPTFPIGYTIKDPTKVAIIGNVMTSHISISTLPNTHYFQSTLVLNATNDSLDSQITQANYYRSHLTGTVTIIDYNP